MRPCPVCIRPMAQRSVSGITVDGCETCGGVWFDRGELTQLARADGAALATLDAEFRHREEPAGGELRTLRCPDCVLPLQQQALKAAPQILVDGFPRCKGIWLHEGELTRLQAIVQELPR